MADKLHVLMQFGISGRHNLPGCYSGKIILVSPGRKSANYPSRAFESGRALDCRYRDRECLPIQGHWPPRPRSSQEQFAS